MFASIFFCPSCILDKSETEIPLPNVKTSVLNKVVKYLVYHADNPAKEIEKPLKSANMAEVVSQWDADFVDVEQEVLFELILVRAATQARTLKEFRTRTKTVPRRFFFFAFFAFVVAQAQASIH